MNNEIGNASIKKFIQTADFKVGILWSKRLFIKLFKILFA